jgi:pyruvate dehydrogenase E1 component beta subunit
MEVPEEEYLIPLGLADIKKAGNDVTIVSFGKIMKVALAAATELEKGRYFSRSDRPANSKAN